MLDAIKILHGPCILTTEMRKIRIQLVNKLVPSNVVNCSGIGEVLKSKEVGGITDSLLQIICSWDLEPQFPHL